MLLVQSALSSKSSNTRTRVWTLISNITLADKGSMLCPWVDGNVTYPTQLLGPVVHTHGLSTRRIGTPTSSNAYSAEAVVLGHADAEAHRRSVDAGGTATDVSPVINLPANGTEPTAPPLQGLFSLSFGYQNDLFQLPPDANDKFLQIQNVTLMQLPQLASRHSLHRLLHHRHLLQQQHATDALPVGIWTILLWSVKR